MGGVQQFTVRSGAPEAEVALGDGGGTVTVVGGTVYYRDEPGVTSSVNDGSIADGGSAMLFGTQFFSTAASRVDGQVRLADVVGSSVVLVAAPTGDATGAGDTALLAAAIATAKAAGGGRVLAKAGVVYQMGIGGSITVKNPSGSTGSRSYSLLLPSNVTLDMNGSTLRLMGSTQCTLVINEAIGGTVSVRDTNVGVVNAVLDNRLIAFTTHSMLQLGYIDGLTLRNVTLSNGIRANGWVYDVTRGVFDDLDAHDIQGQAWTFGDPQATGLGHNGVYDSQFGRLRAHDITLYDTSSQPGNPFNLVLYRCTMDSIFAKNCSAGIKIQQPSEDVTIDQVLVATCGEATALNSGFKIQGDPTYPVGTDRPKRIKVGRVIARANVNIGLYLYHTQDCSVDSYVGYGNVTLHTANADVFLASGINDYVGQIASILSGGAGVRLNNQTAAPVGFRLPNIRVTNPGQQAGSSIKSGVRVDSAAAGSIGDVVVVDDQGVATLTTGFEVTNASAVVAIAAFSSTGQTVAAFTSNASGASQPVAGALTPDVQVFTVSGTWTKPSGYTSTKVSLIAAGGGGGSGARGPTATARVGGGGGAGGAWTEREFKTSDLTTTVAVTIGAAGTGGAAQTVDGTAGVNGTAGATSQFAAFLRAGGGGLGTAGGLAGAGGTAGTGGTGMISGANGGAGAATGGAGGAGAAAAAGAGGGAGGGVSAGNVDNAGGAGSPMTSIGTVTGTGGAASGGAGVAGAGSTAANSPTPGGGGGGGAGSSVGAAGAGGAGGSYGAGGGGGGASLNGFNSGAGGNGAGGICVVISY